MWPSFAVILLFAMGIMTARRTGRTSWWWVPFAGSFLMVTLVMVGRRSMGLSVVAPFSWVIAADVCPY